MIVGTVEESYSAHMEYKGDIQSDTTTTMVLYGSWESKMSGVISNYP